MGSVKTTRSFEERIRSIDRNRQTMDANGYRAVMGRDGLLQMKAKRRMPRLMLPLRLLLAAAIMVTVFKVFLLLRLGEGEYLAHLDSLHAGGIVERAGAWVMQADVVTLWLAQLFAPIVG
ncbi:hypothetical protein [Pseudooceanicola nanhaiensis]|uniref:hypothetical protein n=1 Tax=Pseudooceanicola nanhaiensis TaxID=375761 RepID=UPI001CD40D9D|nr:hypothetical protein [Pseudooceanicola nanhaiensis]MCA0919451.1 hypothetical protein [Pseudooceanicola nanhaiensis]